MIELSGKEIQDKVGMGVGKVEQVASIDALSIPSPVSGKNRKLKSEYQNRKAKKYVFGFLFHPFFDAKNGWSLRNMPTCCSAQTESKLNPSLITRSPKLSAEQNGERRPWK